MHAYTQPFGTLSLPPQHPNCRLTVTVPAKDEADFITATLEALRQQTDELGQPLDPTLYEVIVLANNCSDATASVLRRYAERHPTFRLLVGERTFTGERACVGTARRLLMDTAWQRFLMADRRNGVICTTDADTLVDPDWVFFTLEAVRQGARAVGGRILVPHAADGHGRAYRKQHLQDVTYRSLQYCLESMIDPVAGDPWPRHFQHFGPSTAVRADVYRACGGIPPLRSLEDVGLALALERIDVPITHDPRVRVTTSSRISDRVGGKCFSEQLDAWAALEERRESQRVIGLDNCKRLFKWKVALRRAYERRRVGQCPRLRAMAEQLGLHAAHLELRMATSPTFGQLYQWCRVQLENDAEFADEPIAKAIRELRQFTHSFRHRAAGTLPAGSVPAALG